MGDGIFGSLFDFNGDRKLDALERGMEFMAFQQIMGGGSDDEIDALEAAGISYGELLLMNGDERHDLAPVQTGSQIQIDNPVELIVDLEYN